MIRIMILDDDEMYLKKEKEITEHYFAEKNIDCTVTTYQNVEWFLLGLKEEKFDMYLLDIRMPGENGIEAAREIRRLYPNPVIIFITNLGGLCMRVVVQRVKHASVTINGTVNGKINNGFLVLLGVQSTDSEQDVDYLVKKVTNLRIFSDENDKMNLSLKDVNGELLIVSQFTLYANCKEGNRPSFVEAAKPDIAIPLYEYFVSECKKIIPVVETGIFGADMKVDLLNDGPVTIIMDSK